MRVIRSTQRSTENIVAEVADCVRAGGTVIFPTETVYGIGCDPTNDSAIDAIFALKGRSATKPLALHVTGMDESSAFVQRWNELARRIAQAFWPGPVAIILERNASTYQRAACKLPTISLRCPDHVLCQRILKTAGPLAATSANISGQPAFIGSDDDVAMLPKADLAVLAGLTKWRSESTIVDCTQPVAVVVREGAIKSSAIGKALGTLRSAK